MTGLQLSKWLKICLLQRKIHHILPFTGVAVVVVGAVVPVVVGTEVEDPELELVGQYVLISV